MASTSKAGELTGSGILEAQKTQLVLAFTQAAQAMRLAATEAEAYANLVQTLGPDGKPTTATINAFNSRDRQQLFQFSSLLPSGSTALLESNGGQHAQPATAGRKRRRDAKDKPVKDPKAPKRPASAYLLFQNDVRKEFTERMKGQSYHAVLAEIAKAWANLSPSKKKEYMDKTFDAKKNYDIEKAAYDLSKAEGPSPTTPIAPVPVVAPPLAAPEESEEEPEEEDSPESPTSVEETEESEDDDLQPAKKSKSGPAPPPISAISTTSKKEKATKEKKAKN